MRPPLQTPLGPTINNRIGDSIITSIYSEKHECMYKDGERNGHGITTFPDGEKHEGRYIDGKQDGHDLT